MQNDNNRRITAWVALFVTVFVLLFSTFYIVEHADHICSGDDCPVCAVIEQCGDTLKTLGTAVIIVCATSVLFFILQGKVYFEIHFFPCNSLISQKVRMNN